MSNVKNQKGFMLLETLVVSTFLLGILVFLFIQFSSIKRSYDVSFRYNPIPGLYHAKELATFLSEYGYSSIDNQIGNSTAGYINITNCEYFSSNPLCKKIIDKINAKSVLYVSENISTLKNNLSILKNYNDDVFNPEFKKFILEMNTVEPSGKNRLIIEYNDKTYTTINLEEDSTVEGQT